MAPLSANLASAGSLFQPPWAQTSKASLSVQLMFNGWHSPADTEGAGGGYSQWWLRNLHPSKLAKPACVGRWLCAVMLTCTSRTPPSFLHPLRVWKVLLHLPRSAWQALHNRMRFLLLQPLCFPCPEELLPPRCPGGRKSCSGSGREELDPCDLADIYFPASHAFQKGRKGVCQCRTCVRGRHGLWVVQCWIGLLSFHGGVQVVCSSGSSSHLSTEPS